MSGLRGMVATKLWGLAQFPGAPLSCQPSFLSFSMLKKRKKKMKERTLGEDVHGEKSGNHGAFIGWISSTRICTHLANKINVGE